MTNTEELEEVDAEWMEVHSLWVYLLDSYGFLVFESVFDVEAIREKVYAAFLFYQDRWATADEVNEIAEIDYGDMESLLTGLSQMGELNMTLFDDGIPCYKLTQYGVLTADSFLDDPYIS